ncbi:MAG: response regulator [Schwartzia sp.]|nr:response regulator [Schwartzia sp. (in: firmicutes)]
MNEMTRKAGRSLDSLRKMLAVAVALVFVTLWAGHRTNVLLTRTLERTVARQAADLSVMAEERFGQEFQSLSLAAGLLASAPDEGETARILAELEGGGNGVSVGILSVEGRALSGGFLSRWDFLSLPQAFRGQNLMDYCPGKGLLFAVPIRRGPNIRAVLYRLYRNEVLTDRFSLTNYHPSIRLLLRSTTGLLIVPYKNYGADDKAFFEAPAVRAAFADIRERLGTRRAAAAHVKVGGTEYFLFGSDLPETNCAVAGYIPASAVAGDIALVQERLRRSIGSLLLIFLIVGVYLFRAREKAAESEALRREKAAANLANRAKSEFLANMSHEIRTPINAVLGMNEMILREGKDPAVARYAKNIRSAGRTLLALINDVLDFSKIESGKIEIVEVDYRLSELLGNAVNMAKPRAESKGLAFGLEVDGTLPDALFGDMTRVQQIVVNLLTNAAKYTEKGSVHLCVSGERDAEKGIVALNFVVRDTGIGIREEDKEKLFKQFERLDSVRNRSVEGTGLGLAITKRLATLMGGDVVFESTYGVGSVFTATLPQKIDSDEPIGDFAARLSEPGDEPAYRASFYAPDARILVADDNEMNLLVVEGLLKKTGVQIEAVTDGRSVLERLEQERYDAVLLDHRMPGMDGVETLHAAKKLPNAEGTPFLILTADAVAGMREQFLAEGFDDYLAKPLDGATLEWTLMRFLPTDKVRPAKEADAPPAERAAAPQAPEQEPAEEPPVLDKALGLRYCGNSEEFYREMAGLFCKLHPRKKAQIEAAFLEEHWSDYVTCTHALKSTALSIGGQRLSEAAKTAENLGKRFLSGDTDAAEKEKILAEIRNLQGKLLALYDEFAATVRACIEETDEPQEK